MSVNTKTILVGGKEVTLSKVSNIENIGVKHVYDFEVNEDHNYYADGISVHNCKYHALLKRYEAKLGVELFKLRDTFVLYRHRNLLVYPASPDLRVLRGRTRIFYCIGENELISTDKGLLKMHSVQNGMQAQIANKTGGIRNHTCTGTKSIKRLILDSGQELHATKLHKICVVRKGKITKVKVKDLTTEDRVCIGLGGSYPTELILPDYEVPMCLVDRIIQAVLLAKTFDYSTLENILHVPRRHIVQTIGPIVKKGAISKVYRKGKMITGMDRCYYEVINEDVVRETSTLTNKITIPKVMTPKLAEFIGLLLADGNLMNCGGKGIWFGSSHKYRVDRFTYLSNELFGINNHISTDKARGTKKLSWKSVLCNKHVISFLRKIGLDEVYSADKELPWCILQAPKLSAQACIKAMYLCDGSPNYGQVRYSSTSKKMLLQLQQVLLREGFPTKLVPCSTVEANKDKYDRATITTYNLTADSLVSWSMQGLTGLKVKKVQSGKSYFGKAPAHDVVTSTISEILDVKGKVKVYDMTVDHKRHAYQASGMLVSNSIDEIAYFDNDKDSSKKTMSAEGTYQALNNSLRTVRSKEGRLLSLDYDEAMTGYAWNISSPDNARDKITELVRISQGSTKMLGMHKPTWEMNPEITRASLAEEFRKNPLEALRNFGAQPPLSSNPFIESRESIEDSIKEKGVNYATMRYAIYRTKDRIKQRYATIDRILPSKTKSILAMDAGYSNNSFALACGSLTPEGYLSVDILLDIAPLPDAKLNYTKIYTEIISEIIKARNVTVFLADRWNSPKFLSDAEAEHGLEVARIYSLKYSDMQDVKTSLEQRTMLIPKPKITDIDKILTHNPDTYPQCFDHHYVEHLILQMLTVRDTKKGVIKGDGNLTDDLWRATALLHWGLRNPEFAECLEGEAQVTNMVRAQDMAVMAKGVRSSSASSGKRVGSGSKYIGVKSSRR